MGLARRLARGDITLNTWIDAKETLPKIGQTYACIRYEYPAYVWVGRYREPIDETDQFDWWIPLPDMPIEFEKSP